MLRIRGIARLVAVWSFFLVYRWGRPIIIMQRIADFGRISFCFGFLVDEVRLAFRRTVLVVVLMVYTYSLGYMGEDIISRNFFILLSVFVRRIVLLVFSADFLSMFLAWEGLGVSSFLLVIYFNNQVRASSGIITLISNRLGDVCFLLGLGVMVGLGEFTFLCSEVGGRILFFFACVSKRAQ